MIASKLGKVTTLLVLVIVLGLGTYGCGGESPTPTAAPTATSAAATNPTIAPTATLEAQPTAMTEQPTATAGASGGGTGGGGNSSDAMSVLRRTAGAMKAVTTFHVVINTNTVSMTLTMEGDVARPGKMRLAMNAAGVGGTEVLVVDGAMYSKI